MHLTSPLINQEQTMASGYEESENRHLYRFEFYEPEDRDTYVEWVWLKTSEISGYRAEYTTLQFRPASRHESDLYEEAYEDGYSIAAMLEYEDKFDGVTFRIEVDDKGDLAQGRKMFQCSVCDKHKDFDDEVGAVNGFYLTELRGEVLWHICYECATIAVVMEGLDIDITEEGEASS
mgnify:CR=1 FL=1|tara:strand:+ start:37 stop:567 length:531 start_codon:yes stop_codon:yes gene_type:complete